MKLYFKPTSPYARKVRVVIEESGMTDRVTCLEPPLRDVNSELWKVNPVGMIPALVTDEGELVIESNVICEYIDSLSTKNKLFPINSNERWPALKLNVLGTSMIDSFIARIRESWRSEELRNQDLLALETKRIENILNDLDNHADKFQGDLNIGHISVGCALSLADRKFPDEDWRKDRPRLSEWYERFNARESMRSTYAE